MSVAQKASAYCVKGEESLLCRYCTVAQGLFTIHQEHNSIKMGVLWVVLPTITSQDPTSEDNGAHPKLSVDRHANVAVRMEDNQNTR